MSSPASKLSKLLQRLTTLVSPGNRNENFHMENEKMLLEESVTLFNGTIDPIRCFSFQELENASNNFDENLILLDYGPFKLYRCSLQNRMVILKKYEDPFPGHSPIRDIVVASRMSAHKNVMKLIGYCLETKLPILVFDCECTLHQPFSLVEDWIQTLQWKDRLEIAVDLSNLLEYLYTAFPTPIVHRGFYPRLFLPDNYGCLKLFDFSSSIPIPKGKSSIKDKHVGCIDYIAPEYMSTGKFNEKIDVYSFGIVLLILLSRGSAMFPRKSTMVYMLDQIKRCEVNGTFDKILDPMLSGEGPWPGKYNQFEDVLRLALCCTKVQPDDRPDITYVAKQLKEMQKLLTPDS